MPRSPAVLLALAASAAAAQDPEPTVKVHGYVEAFYQLNFNWPSNLVTAYRGFDDRSNSFTISNAALDVTGALGPVGARLALQVGHAPSSYYSAEPTYRAQAGTGVSDPQLWRIVQQAYLSYQVPIGRGLLTEAGIFLSPVGLENLPIQDQWNWSRSDLFFALPYYHSGVRFTYPFSERFTGVVYVVNGWNNVVNRNPYPCVAGMGTYTVTNDLAVQVLYMGGVEPPTGAPEGQPWRNLFDGTVSWNLAPWLALAAQADAGFEVNNFGTTTWYDGAGYVRVHPHPKLFLTARVDHLRERDGANAAGSAPHLFFPAGDVGSETLTIDFRPEARLSLRLEGRRDHANAPIYFKGTVPNESGTDVPTSRVQHTLTLGAVASY